MALLATPQKLAFCIDSKDEAVLHRDNGAALEAFSKIRAVEAKHGDPARVQALDARIEKLHDRAAQAKF